MSLTTIVSRSLIAISLLTPIASQGAVTIVNNDSASEGFNDATPVSAVGGNSGTTLGQQRLNVFNKAAEILNTVFDIQQPVQVNAQFNPLTCTSSSAVLGQAGPADYTFIDQGGGDFILYPDALYNQISGSDIDPTNLEINATFNSTLDAGTSCLGGTSWYYGFDDNPAAGSALLPVVLHEIMHGMGFLSLMSSTGASGATINNGATEVFDVYTRLLKRQSTNTLLKDMTPSQRAAAITSDGDLVWSGANVNARASEFTSGINSGSVRMYAPTAYQSGSSVGHFDSALSPNEIMEPSYTQFLDDPGLATQLLVDIGWTLASPSPANSAPVISAITNQSLDEDSDKTLSLSATDADGDSLTFSITSAPSQLNASISGTNLTLNPIADFNGNNIGPVTIQVSDGSLTDSTSFNVTVNAVNDAPVISAITNQSLDEDSDKTLSLSATDADGDSLTFSITSAPSQLNASISGTNLTLNPIADFNSNNIGPVTIQVSDGSLTDTTSFNVTVNAINDAPVISAITNQSLNEDSDKTLSLSATDADGDSLTFSITSAPSQLNASISGTNLTLNPIADFNGNNIGPVTIQVSDGSLTDSTSFNVTVNAVNDAPVFNAQSDINLVNTNTSVITLSATDIDSASNTLVYSVASFDSAFLTASISTNQLTITPKTGATGSSNVTVQVSDGDKTDQQTFAVNLSNSTSTPNPTPPPAPTNQAPVLSAIGNQVLLAGDTLTVNLSATDADNDSLSYSVAGSTAGIQASINGTALSITAADNASGDTNLTVSVNDGQDSDSEVVRVTVYPAFALSDGNNQIRTGETLRANLTTTDLQLSGGNNQLTLAVFFNGTQQNNLLTRSNAGYQLALPASGAFAGIYRIDVTDSNNLSSHFFIERPLRLLTSATPLLDLAEQQLWIEGAPAGSNITLSSDTDKLAFHNSANQEVTEVIATDQAERFNRATANLELVAGQLPERITFTATSPNIPESQQLVETLTGKSVSIQVTDTSDAALSNAVVNAEDSRLAGWQLAASARSNDSGNATMILPREDVQLTITAENFIDQPVVLSANDTDLTVKMEKMTAPFTITGQITAQGFNFSSERPQVRLNLNDGSADNLEVSLDESNTTARFEAQLDLNVKSPVSITIQHSQASTLTQSIPQGVDNLTLALLLLALPVDTDDEALDTGSAAGNGTLLLLLVTILSLIRRKPFTV